jgi:hypothetical protein
MLNILLFILQVTLFFGLGIVLFQLLVSALVLCVEMFNASPSNIFFVAALLIIVLAVAGLVGGVMIAVSPFEIIQFK